MGTVLTRMVSTPFRWIKDWLTLANATVARITKGDYQYTIPSGAGAPHVVYMRSAALHKMVKNKLYKRNPYIN